MSTAANQASIRNGVVRRTEHSFGDQGLTGRKQTKNRMNLGNLESLFEGLCRQNCGNTPSQHGFTATWRPDHQDIMASGRRNFERPLGMPLTAHFGKIDVIFCRTAK